jgi:hypothetical protein
VNRRTWVFWFWVATLGCSASDQAGAEPPPSSTVARPAPRYPDLPPGAATSYNTAQVACHGWARVVCEREYDCGNRNGWDGCILALYDGCREVRSQSGEIEICLTAERARDCKDPSPRTECQGIFRTTL